MKKQELANKIWLMVNKMRSNIKSNEYKDYILGLIFYKFLSDKECIFLKNQGFTSEQISIMNKDMIDLIKDNIGYVIFYDDLFSTWKLIGDNLNIKTVSKGLNNFNNNINVNQKSIFYNIFSTLQNNINKYSESSGLDDMVIRDIIDIIDNIPTNEKLDYDVLGYIYEYLIYKFATTFKEDGAYYTPNEVSLLMAMIIANACKDKNELKVYDPTSGSATLMLNVGKELSKYIDKNSISYYGQEKITEIYNLTRMNLIMRGIPYGNIIVRNGDTLDKDWPYFDENIEYNHLKVNAIVSNPPYSLHWVPQNYINDDRYKNYGLAPQTKADYAFLLHCLYHLEDNGLMAIVLPQGVLFRESTEYEIRKKLCIEHNIETIIRLPSNLFFTTTIPTIIMILRKNRLNDDVLFIDASQNYEKGKNQNILRNCDIKKIFDAVVERQDINNFAKLVSYKNIKENNYNLNISKYVNAIENKKICNFSSFIYGTIPNEELDVYDYIWNEFKTLRSELFINLGNGYSLFNDVNINEVIRNNNYVLYFIKRFDNKLNDLKIQIFNIFKENSNENIENIKDIIVNKIFEMIFDMQVIDKYDMYQLFMNNWSIIETEPTIIKKDTFIIKWIDSLFDEIQNIPNQVINNFVKEINNIKNKYVKSLREINREIKEKEKEFVELLNQLVGSNADMTTIEELKNIFE